MKRAFNICIFTLAFVLTFALLSRANDTTSCVIVRPVGHKGRTALIGAATFGLGAIPAAALSGKSYERLTSFGDVPYRDKYSGKMLRQMSARGVHVVVTGKDWSDVSNPMGLCGFDTPTPRPVMTRETEKLMNDDRTLMQPARTMENGTHQNGSPRKCVEYRTDRFGNETCVEYEPRR